MKKFMHFSFIFILPVLLFVSCSNNSTYERLIKEKLASKPVNFEYNGEYINDYLNIKSVSIMKTGISDDRGSGFASISCSYNDQNLDLAVYFGVGKGYDNQNDIYVAIQEPLVSKQRLVSSSMYQRY